MIGMPEGEPGEIRAIVEGAMFSTETCRKHDCGVDSIPEGVLCLEVSQAQLQQARGTARRRSQSDERL